MCEIDKQAKEVQPSAAELEGAGRDPQLTDLLQKI